MIVLKYESQKRFSLNYIGQTSNLRIYHSVRYGERTSFGLQKMVRVRVNKILYTYHTIIIKSTVCEMSVCHSNWCVEMDRESERVVMRLYVVTLFLCFVLHISYKLQQYNTVNPTGLGNPSLAHKPNGQGWHTYSTISNLVIFGWFT